MSEKETTPEEKGITLTSPDSKRTWTTNDRAEITNLRAQGWHQAKPTAEETPEPNPALAEVKAVAAPANKSVAAKSK